MKHIARSSLIVAGFFALDKILGFFRQLLVARQFALSYDLDVFNAANNIPDFLSALISGGALGVALIPVLSEYFGKIGKPEAWRLFSRIINLAFIVTALIALVIAIFARWLVDVVIVPGFPPEQRALTVELMRLDLIAIIIFSISGLCMAGLQSNQHFLLPAMAPAFYDVGQIFGVAILAPEEGYQIGPLVLPSFGLGVHGLVYGVIIGSLLHLLIQLPGLFKYKFEWIPAIGFWEPGVQKVLSLLGPRVITMFFIQLFYVVRDNLASGLGEGAVTALNLGWFVMQVPETMIGTAIAIVLLPTMSEIFNMGDFKGFTTTINKGIRIILALTIPSATFLAIGISPLISWAFQFDDMSTHMVVIAAQAYLVGLVGHSLLEIAARAYYAQKNAITPLIAAALNSLSYIVLASTLSRLLGHVGIAITNSLVFTTQALVLLFLLNRQYPGMLSVLNTIIRVSIPTLICAIGLFSLMKFNSLQPLFSSLGGMVVSMIVVLPFILPEIRTLMQMGTRK